MPVLLFEKYTLRTTVSQQVLCACEEELTVWTKVANSIGHHQAQNATAQMQYTCN